MKCHECATPAFSDAQVLSDRSPVPGRAKAGKDPGFTLIEMMIALLILSIGLLAMGQLIFAALSSASLARSKGNAALAAQDKLEFLGDLCRRNPAAFELSTGSHDGEPVQYASDSGEILNRFGVSWTVSDLSDPRNGTELHAKQVLVSVTPIDMNGNRNSKVLLNKTVDVSCIFYTGTP
jgi:prepilin-type N-terminal cleavage/methylation domain-containing protein